MKIKIILAFSLLLLISSCTFHRYTLSVEPNDNLELIAELEADNTIEEVITYTDQNRAFILEKAMNQNLPNVTKLTDKEGQIVIKGYGAFVLSEINEQGVNDYFRISCLNTERYFYNFVKGDQLYLFSYISHFEEDYPYSVFLRIINLAEKKVVKEQVIRRKYIELTNFWLRSDAIQSYEPLIKVAPNKEFFAIYMAHTASDMMGVWTVDVFDSEAKKLRSEVLNIRGTLEFEVENDGNLLLSCLYIDNYQYYYNVELMGSELYKSDSKIIPRVRNEDKTHKIMLPDFDQRPNSDYVYKYHENFGSTNQFRILKEDKTIIANYVVGKHGNGGVLTAEFDKNEGKIDKLNLIPFHAILDSIKKNNDRFYVNNIPSLNITNFIEHENSYYIVLELLYQNYISVDGAIYLIGNAGDQYILALDENFNLKWANATNRTLNFLMNLGKHSDDYNLQGGSKFEVKDGKLTAINMTEAVSDSFFGYSRGYFRVNYDLQTGELLESKLLVNKNGNSKIFYNNFYPIGDKSIIVDQNFKDEFYLIKEK